MDFKGAAKELTISNYIWNFCVVQRHQIGPYNRIVEVCDPNAEDINVGQRPEKRKAAACLACKMKDGVAEYVFYRR